MAGVALMIEHRILERKVKRPRGIDDHGMFTDYVYVDVPQYRRGEYRKIYSGTAPPLWVGTDWLDVPRVRE